MRSRKRDKIRPVTPPLASPTIIFGRTGQLTFVEVFLALILAWILVSLWERFIENLAFGTFGLNRESSLHALIVAAGVTAIFLAFTFSTVDLSEVIEQHAIAGGG